MDLLDTNQNDPIQIDQNIDPMEVLTGPGGKFERSKYESEEDMYKAIAKSKVESDSYINHLKQRQDELRSDYTKLRDEYNTVPKLKEILDQYSQKPSTNVDTQNVADDKPAYDPKQIEDLVASKLSQIEQQRKEEANYKTVEAKLTEVYGANYAQHLKQQIDSLGLDKDFVNDLARKHPQVLFKTLGVDQPRQTENFQTPPRSQERSGFTPQGNKRTNAYYQKLRKENPVLYRDPKTQDQMFKDALSLGDSFNDGDWSAYGH